MPRYQDDGMEPIEEERPLRDHGSSVPNLPVEVLSPEDDPDELDSYQKLLECLNTDWANKELLTIHLVEIAVLYKETAEELGAAISGLSATFIAEKELEPSMTVTEADHRAKQAFAGKIERLRGKLESLDLLHKTALYRITFLQT